MSFALAAATPSCPVLRKAMGIVAWLVAVAVLSVVGSALTLAWFLTANGLFHPGSGPLGINFEGALRDPSVFDAARTGALLSAIVTFVLAAALLRGLRLFRCFVFSLAWAFFAIGLLTPLFGPFAWMGTQLSLIGAFLCCRLSPVFARPTAAAEPRPS